MAAVWPTIVGVEPEPKLRAGGRIHLRPSAAVTAYLQELAHMGVLGQSPTEVAEALVSREIERLIKEEFFTKARQQPPA
jgi:hypothetical protein